MIVRYLLAALGAGLLAGLLILPVQYARLVPLIVHAENYENGGGHEHSPRANLLVSPAAAHSAGEAGGEHADEEGGAFFESRLAGTLVADLVTGAGFALVLAGASLVLGRSIGARDGTLWGLAGFAVVSLAPALGLAPELPAMPAADLGTRQVWWIATVALAALGLWALVLSRSAYAKAAGVFAIVLPHLWGAPQPADLASPVPPGLAAEFVVASLATAALFWAMLGWFLGIAFDRLRHRAPVSA